MSKFIEGFEVNQIIIWGTGTGRSALRGEKGRIDSITTNSYSEPAYQTEVLTGSLKGQLLFGSGTFYETAMNRNGANS